MCIVHLFIGFPSSAQCLHHPTAVCDFKELLPSKMCVFNLFFLKIPASHTWASAQLASLTLGLNLPILKDKRWLSAWGKSLSLLAGVCTTHEVACNGFGYLDDVSSQRTLPQMHLWPFGLICEDFCINMLDVWVDSAKPALERQVRACKWHTLCFTKDSSTATAFWKELICSPADWTGFNN